MDAREMQENTELHERWSSRMTFRCRRCGRDIQAPILLAHAKAEEYLVELIKRDHPEWMEPDGACPGCEAYYRVLVERTGV